ncbi:hypothetical protein LTR28_005762, partial [Elasticomyces elasticus]
MSNRRAGANRIRGPHSALTDFLAANNISAAQIRDDYERRQREAERDRNAGEGSAHQEQKDSSDDEDAALAQAAAEEASKKAKKRKRGEKEVIEKIKKAKAAEKAKGSKKGKKKPKRGESDEEDDDDYDDALARNMYKKAKPPPGQFEHCEICSKRFTVTPYSKDGPDGGLVCTPCGKELTKEAKAEQRAATKKPVGRKRRKVESDRLDGLTHLGSKSLQQLCIEKVAQHHNQIDSLGDLPGSVYERLSQIFSKKRVMNPKTLPVFLRPDLDKIAIDDAAYLEVDDYKQIFAVVPHVEHIVLRNACQFKDEVV